MYHILKQNLEIITQYYWEEDNNIEKDDFKRAVSIIKEIPGFEKLADKAFNTADYLLLPFKHDKAVLDVIYAMRAVISVCEEAGTSQTDGWGFDIKMPPVDDFSEFAGYINDFNRFLSQCPYLKFEDESISFKKVDLGSIWLEFLINNPIGATAAGVGASKLLLNLIKIVDECVKIKSHIITCKQQEEMMRSAKIKNDALENLIEQNNKLIEIISINCAEELSEKLGKPENEHDYNETKNSLAFSLRLLSKLMANGLEICASIDSSQEVKDLFPTSKEIKHFSKPPKKIEEPIEDDE